MNTTNMAVGAGVLVTLGRWASGKGLSVRVVVGVVILALALSVLPPKVAKPFAALIIVAVLFKYGPSIINATGITKNAPAS